MVSITELEDDEQVTKVVLSLSESLLSSADTSNVTTTNINLLEEKLGGPSGVITYLLPRVWLSSGSDNNDIKGDGALSILTYLVENKPADYMAATASSVRQSISTTFNQMSDIDEQRGPDAELDPINGGSALRLLTEVCRVGILSSVSINEETQGKFHLLLSGLKKALEHFHPQGELERLSYIYSISSLVGCCTAADNDMTKNILNDTTLVHGWLSLHSKLSQPKLKSTVLSSLSQVVEPSLWEEVMESNNVVFRPSDSIVLQLYQQLGDANNGIDSAELILDSAKSPFVEERLGAYDLLRALVMRGNIVRLLLLQGSFIELLLNQDLESTIEGKKSKHKIVVALLESNADILEGLLSNKAIRTLKEWKDGGTNFVKATTFEMATE